MKQHRNGTGGSGMSKGRITGIHHIGVTVNDADRTVKMWAEALGVDGKVVDVPQNDLRIGIIRVAGITFFFNEYTSEARQTSAVGDLELPVTYSGHRIVNQVGEGISHIALETTDLDSQLAQAKQAGMAVLHAENKDALEGVCNFLSPEDAGLPLEFMQAIEGRENPLA